MPERAPGSIIRRPGHTEEGGERVRMQGGDMPALVGKLALQWGSRVTCYGAAFLGAELI